MRMRFRPITAASSLTAIALLLLVPVAWAVMPLETSTAWQSTPLGHVATGGAWVDVDGDGWLDMVAANGNDISIQSVVIYHNNGDGTFPLTPSWSSTDTDYHGHLDTGDINGDGLPDIVVGVYIGHAGFSQPGYVKAYFNTGTGGFSSTPDWQSAIDFYCFSVGLGDVDGDGDLDLACSAGESYYHNPEQQKVFYNIGGTFETLPSWQSDEIGYSLDPFWDDVDLDGDLDLVYCGIENPMRLYENQQTTGGGLSTTAVWESTDLPQDGNTTAFADWDGDGYPELAVADNDQLGGQGLFKVYGNSAGTLSGTPVWTSNTGGYGSHVSWIDLDVDGDPDLAAGRWWGNVRLYENQGGGLSNAPVWTSTTNSVIENMFWGDVDNDGLRSDGVASATGDGNRTYFKLGRAPVRAVDEVRVGGVPLPPAAYAVHLVYGWVSLATPPALGISVEIDYTYSLDLDLGVTNWDSNKGNYLFINNSTVDVPDVPLAMQMLRAQPNPVRHYTSIRYMGEGVDDARLSVYDVTGRMVRVLHDGPLGTGLRTWEWDGRNAGGARVAHGIYFARLTAGGMVRTLKLVVL